MLVALRGGSNQVKGEAPHIVICGPKTPDH